MGRCAKVPYLTNGTSFLSYDDKRSIKGKAKYIKSKSLAGVIVWNVFGDMLNLNTNVESLDGKLKYAPNTIYPLVNALNEAFAGAAGSAPTVSITSPANNATFAVNANVTISATAVDSDGTISKVEFFNGATLIATDTSSPYFLLDQCGCRYVYTDSQGNR